MGTCCVRHRNANVCVCVHTHTWALEEPLSLLSEVHTCGILCHSGMASHSPPGPTWAHLAGVSARFAVAVQSGIVPEWVGGGPSPAKSPGVCPQLGQSLPDAGQYPPWGFGQTLFFPHH